MTRLSITSSGHRLSPPSCDHCWWLKGLEVIVRRWERSVSRVSRLSFGSPFVTQSLTVPTAHLPRSCRSPLFGSVPVTRSRGSLDVRRERRGREKGNREERSERAWVFRSSSLRSVVSPHLTSFTSHYDRWTKGTDRRPKWTGSNEEGDKKRPDMKRQREQPGNRSLLPFSPHSVGSSVIRSPIASYPVSPPLPFLRLSRGPFGRGETGSATRWDREWANRETHVTRRFRHSSLTVSCRVSLATSGRRFLGSLRSPRYLLPSVARPSGHEEKEKGEGRGVERIIENRVTDDQGQTETFLRSPISSISSRLSSLKEIYDVKRREEMGDNDKESNINLGYKDHYDHYNIRI